MISKNELINVLNYNDNPVCIRTRLREYVCAKAENGQPSVTPLEFSEIEELNGISPCFKIGTLFFEKDKQEEIYTALRITDWQNILKNEDIKDIILNPTYENLNRILKIDNVAYFERIRGTLYSLKNADKYDLSIRVTRLIDARYKELRSRKYKTSIVITKAENNNNNVSNKELSAIREENKDLKAQLDKMQETMNMLLNSLNKEELTKAESQGATIEKTVSRGRPPKKTE